MTISSSSLLVEMNICTWSATKADKTTTAQVNADANADVNAAQVRKNLMAGTTLRKQIADYTAGCRTWHTSRTLPWSDRGPRLLPTSLFFDYKSEANIRKATFEQMADQFVADYPALVMGASYHLGNLFDAADYPSVEEVRDKFSFNLVFSPVPEAGDFRLDIPQLELDEVKVAYDASFNDRLADAMKEPWERLHAVLTATVTKLTDGDGDEKKRYHDTLITNAQSLCGLLSHLNVTGDATLEQARREMERAMMGVNIEDIRDNAGVRADAKQRLETVLKQFW